MANKKRKFGIGRKKKQFDHRINFKTKKPNSKKLDGIKLISLSEDTLNDHVPVDSSSVENEEMSLDENEDANYSQEEGNLIDVEFNFFNNNENDNNCDFQNENCINEESDYFQHEDHLKDDEYELFREIDENCNLQEENCEANMNYSEYDSDSDSEMESDVDCQENSGTDSFSPQGNRIVDLNFVFEQIKEMNSHSAKCNFNDMNLLSGHEETKRGFNVSYRLICSKCSYMFTLKNTKENDVHLDLNYAAVLGSFAVGIGYSQLQEFTGILGIPSMAQSTFVAHQRKILEDLEGAAKESMRSAAEIEKENAIRNGNVDANGKPVVKAYFDTAWSKRSYGSNYSSFSGTASLIGHHTKKVIWNGVANKYCIICTRIATKNLEPYEHDCNIDYVGTSTGMEAKLAVDGFRECEELYGFRIGEIIADGDSNVLLELNKSNVYKYPMLKISKLECCNHLFKNAIKKLMKLAKEKMLKSYLTRDKVNEIIKGIRCAKDHWVKSGLPQSIQIENLRNDILNAPAHVFGSHEKCADYFCKKKDKNEPNIVNIMKKNKVYNSILNALSIIRVNARSVLIYENTNVVERVHSMFAKFNGGKRVNYTKSKSYKGRCRCGVIQHNTRRLYSTLCEYKNKTPQPTMNNLEFKRMTKNLMENVKERKYVPKRHIQSGPDCDYGACDKNELEFDFEKNRFLEEIEKNFSNWNSNKKNVDSEKCTQWNSIEAMLLTSSHFGTVCTGRSPESFENIVNKILYEETDTANQIDHETTYKSHALSKLEDLKNIKVDQCGLFIDQNIHTLGATPDGLVGTDGIVIIKCPLSTFEIEVEKSILAGNLPFWKKQNKRKNNPEFVPAITGLNMKHKWYYQAQGQLHITQREYCYLVVWASDELPLRIERIEKDNHFWQDNMESNLKMFYEKVLLPELVDSRASRRMPLRKFDKNFVCVG